jgi:hypothetical protein
MKERMTTKIEKEPIELPFTIDTAFISIQTSVVSAGIISVQPLRAISKL